jgi:hypothetical protein
MLRTTITTVAAFAALVGVFISFVPQADAIVCARGVYRAGCAGAHGAVVGHGGYGGVYRGGVYRGGVYHGGVYRGGVYRRY